MPAKKFKAKAKVEIKEEVVEEKVMTTKDTKKSDVIYGNEKSDMRCVEVECIASRGQMIKGIRYYVTKEIAKEYASNLKSI